MIVTDLSNSFHPCPKPKVKEKQRKVKEIKKKSSKLEKLERQRDKKIIKYGKIYMKIFIRFHLNIHVTKKKFQKILLKLRGFNGKE